MTVKAVVVRYGIVLTSMASKLVVPVIVAPTVTNNNDGTISLSSTTSNAKIYYTTNGTTPSSSNGTLYENTPFSLGNTTVIKAITYNSDLSESSEVTTYNVPQYTAPTISFNSSTSQVTITSEGTVYYNTGDGSQADPTTSSTEYSTPFTVSSATTIKAIATHAGYLTSEVASLAITQVAMPTIQNNGSNAVSITCATEGATIYYTTDGSAPTTSSTEYTGPLTEGFSGVTIKAIAVKENMIPSAVGSGTVTLQCEAPVIVRSSNTSFTVTCAFPSSGVTIYYTTGDGTQADPTTSSSSVPSGGTVTVALPITVKAMAVATNYSNSSVATVPLSTGMGGDGSAANPYTIEYQGDVDDFVTKANTADGASKCYKVIATTSLDFSRAAAISEPFTGTFDGGLHTISGLTHPLFNTIHGGTVKNVILDNVNISGGTNVGAIANEMTGTADHIACIYNCGVRGTVTRTINDDGEITAITCSSSVSGSGAVGGIVGMLGQEGNTTETNNNCYARVINCFSYASVSGGSGTTGGIVGKNCYASKSGTNTIRTMVMNCMFYGTGSGISPIYGGLEISNRANSNLNNYNYFCYENLPSGNISSYNCALAAEERFLIRFEFYRNLLNSNRELAAWYATGSVADANTKMAKWVLETADRTIESPMKYPVLKIQGKYPSIVNIDADHAETLTFVDGKPKEEECKQGRKLNKTLTVKITAASSWSNKPSGADLKDASYATTGLTLQRTDKDYDRFNFNYDKVQLPYYNDIGTMNYTGNKVVTGWKITSIDAVAGDPYTASNYNYSKTYASDASYFNAQNFNYADRKSSNKDLYSVSSRVFSQGAYFDVPEGVSEITIEPYWGNASYLSDKNYDCYGYETGNGVTDFGTRYEGDNEYSINGSNQKVYNTINEALADEHITGTKVYDNVLVLVGNHHVKGTSGLTNNKPFTIMSIDLNTDNEPDYSLIISSGKNEEIPQIRFDFINVPGVSMAHKMQDPNNTYMGILGNSRPKGWFEVTNTAVIRFSQFEYDQNGKTSAPLILQGGVVEQIVSTNWGNSGDRANTRNTIYLLLGGNVWFKMFNNGVHMDRKTFTPHNPISITGGEYEKFYLSGMFRPDADSDADNAECYISGGKFGEVAGAGQEKINGNVTWKIDRADIDYFYGGGINPSYPISGNIDVTVKNSHITRYCGGPKFGDMASGKTVKTEAFDSEFGEFFGAGYGGTAFYRDKTRNEYTIIDYSWGTWDDDYVRGKYTSNGIATDFEYEHFEGSNDKTVARFYVNYASLSLAETNDVTSELTDCTVKNNFYGGGSLGKVKGTATSTLTRTTVEGDVFGAGYSAKTPTVDVYNTGGFTTIPRYNVNTGVFEKGVFPASISYTWSSKGGNTNTTTLNDEDGHWIHTDKDLTQLGQVNKAILTINDGTEVKKSVYGGGEESAVNSDTEVTISGGTIGTTNLGGATYGNVYGGGKGKAKNEVGENYDELTLVKMGLVKGTTSVTIAGGDILHNVYGGGAYGSVGTYNYDASGNITSLKTENTGTATINITGGTIGTTGKENGMVFGSSRGDVDRPGAIHDRLAWVHDTHVTIGTSGQGSVTTTPLIKGSIYGSGENGHTYQNTVVDVHSGKIGINDNNDPDGGATYRYRGNVYGGGCGTDKYYSSGTAPTGHTLNDGYGDTYNSLAGIVLGNATVNIDGGLVVHNVYGAGAMGSVGDADKRAADATASGKATINISGGTIGVSGTVGDGNVFGAARGDINDQTAGLSQIWESDVNISSNANIYGSVYGGGEAGLVKEITDVSVTGGTINKNVYGGGDLGDVGTYTTDANDANIYPEGSGICNVSITGGTIGVDGNGNGNVFGAGKGDAGTFKCMKAMVYKTNVAVSNGTVWGNVYGGGEIGRVENDTKVEIGTDGEITDTSKPDIKGSVFGAGKGLDTHGYSALVRGNPVVTVQGSAKVGRNVYGGGEIASVGKHSLVTDGNKDQHTELEVGMPFTLANNSVGVCTVTVKDKAEITGNVFGAGKGVKPAEMVNPGRMTPTGTMEYYNASTYGTGWENALHIYVQTLALVTDTHVSIGGTATGTATKVLGSVYGGSESGFVQYNTNVAINQNCTIGTSSVEGNVYGGGLGIAGNDVAGRVGGNTKIDINNGTTHGSVFGGGAYGVVKGSVNVNINDGIIDKDVYGGGALAHTNTGMWDDAHNALLEYAEVKNLIVDSSPVTGYFTRTGTEGNYTYSEITAANTTAASETTYYAKYTTTVNLTGGKLRNAYGGGLGVHDIGEDGQTGYVEGTPAYVYGDVMVKLNEGVTSANASTTKGCIVEKVFGCNNLKGTPKGHVQVHVYATQNANTGTYPHITPKHAYHTTDAGNLPETGSTSTYDVLAVYGGGNLAPFDPVDAYSTDASKKAAARCEVIIDGCDLTSIRQVYAGGNAAPAPATLVQVYGTYEIEEVFGGGNGKDDYTVNNGTTDEWFKNPGANVGYRNYTHLVGGESGGDGTSAHPYVCAENSDALTKEARQTATLGDGSLKYMYGSGVATTEIYGGKIHYVYGGSNEKGNISIEAMSIYEEGSGAGSCDMDLDQTYGGGKNSEIDGTINMGLGCVQNMKETFGGSKNADVNSDIVLNITNGTYGKVFGGNNTSGNINGSITVNIYENGCSPVRIGELYLGGYKAGYSIYGYKEVNGEQQPRTEEDWTALTPAQKEAEGLTVPRKDPRINIISATRIDNVFGGGYEATVVGNPHVNVNMEKGKINKDYLKTDADKTAFLANHSDDRPYYTWTGESVDATSGDGILPIGTIGTIYGGGNMADIVGNTYVEIGTGFWLKEGTNDVWETKNAAGATYTYERKTGSDVWKWYDKDGEEATTTPTPARYTAKITGNIYGGGDNAAVQGNTHVNVCAVNADDPATTDVIEMTSVTLPSTIGNDVTIGGSIFGGGNLGDIGNYTKSGKDYIFDAGGKSYVTIAGGTIGTQASPSDVFGGGQGNALESGDGAFMCEKAMVDYTNVVISNGTVNGTVYGGGKIGRVNHDTEVTIGLKREANATTAVSTPVVEKSVYGAGKGLSTHGYAALVRGNSKVTVQGDAKVKDCVYGGGEIASVGKYSLDAADMPQSLANNNSGYCTVIVQDNAEVGPDAPMSMITESGYPVDAGHVFGAGKGILPYDLSDLPDPTVIPWRVKGNNTKQQFGEGVYVYEEGKENSDYKEAYLTYIETLGLATQTYVTVAGNALVKGSVYGGSMNGHVQHDTNVTIAGGQIGCQKGTAVRLLSTVWEIAPSSVTEDYECDSWPYGVGENHEAPFNPYDIYDYQTGTTKPKSATDGHTFYGNVFGGGSGYYPYAHNPKWEVVESSLGNKSKKELGYADGLWHREAGSVGGNTVVNITGGHILTSVYGGNEQTDVGTYIIDTNGDRTPIAGTGHCTINMNGGTIGVPRNPEQIKAHPVTCYVFGAGKGDPRINFNNWTNVASTQVNISGNARIYGSTFGGGEDGHVVRDAETNIGDSFTMTINGVETSVQKSNAVLIGSTGTSGADGNIFGGGRGFSEMALTAGVVGGCVRVNIQGGTMLGSVFGGGRLASVGTYFANAENNHYGEMQIAKTEKTLYTAEEAAAYNTMHNLTSTDAGYINAGDIKTPEITHGYITVTIDGGTIGATDNSGKLVASNFSIGDVFGGCKGSAHDVRFGTSKNTSVSIRGAKTKINGNVYGGGESGDVGIITRDLSTYNYSWKNSDGANNTAGNNIENTTTAKNSGVCTVTISGGTIGDEGKTATKGNVFGAGKGLEDTFWCEKAMVFATDVSISGSTKVYGNVYGGGEVGRVEDDAKVEINTSGGSEVPDIKGNVYGAGAGLKTHGYSALVRGNSIVTIKGNSKVGGSVFGGGETASLGRFKLDERKMPKEPDGGGSSTVTITDNAKIGLSGTDHDVYGAGQGVEPNWVYTENSAETPYATRITNSKRMMTYTSTKHLTDTRYKEWDYYEDDEDSPYVWEYYPSKTAYLEYLKTLAIASHPVVTIAENATVYGDVYGGGQRGITLGDVAVNIAGGTVKQDVYGGGSLADTNKGNWDDSQYSAVTLPAGHTLTDLYTRTGGSGTAEDPYTYSEATSSTGADANTTYYSKGTWATGKYDNSTHATFYKTNVILTGGEIEGDVYGGGLGQIAREAVAAQPALSAVKAKVYGDVLVKLNEDTDNNDCKVHGNIFGCNNQNGSPQSAVTVHVYKTEGWTDHMRTGKQLTGSDLSAALNDPVDSNHSYELKGVYGGGNLSAFYPDLKATRDTVQAYVIIDGCDLTSIQTVYGGGNAASVPASNVTINATYEIEEVFGGGNGKEDVSYDGGTTYVTNPGANVGYEEYPTAYDIPESSKTERTAKFSYGSGKANVTIYDGLIHRVFGGSNTKGNVRESAVTLLDDMSGCDFQIDEAYGGGKNAPMDAEAKLLMACIPGLKAAYGGAQEADVLGGVNLTITNGTYERIFGGNNISGTIQGPIVVNIEETGCRPIVIGELYGGGNKAGYSVYGYDGRTPIEPGENVTKQYNDPVVNVKSFTSIGNIFGGGFGASAKMIGDPTVNINVVKGKYSNYVGNSSEYGTSGYTYDATGYKGQTMTIGSGEEQVSVTVPAHKVGTIGAINNVFGGGNEAEVKGTPHVNIGTMMGEPITLVSQKIEDSEGHAPSDAEWTPSYAIMTVEGADIRGNVYGGGNNAPVTGNTDVQIGKNNAIKTYSFTSYSAAEEGTAYSTGLAQTTGVTKNNLSEVVILTNGKYGEFVGNKYYIDPTIKTDGSERKQLMDDENHETGMWVAIKPFEKKKTYSFTSYSAVSGGTEYSTGTATATGNFKVISIGNVDTDCMQIQVLTNPGETSWEGKTFYVPIADATRRQLYKADGTAIDVWVEITE